MLGLLIGSLFNFFLNIPIYAFIIDNHIFLFEILIIEIGWYFHFYKIEIVIIVNNYQLKLNN